METASENTQAITEVPKKRREREREREREKHTVAAELLLDVVAADRGCAALVGRAGRTLSAVDQATTLW